MFASAAIVAAVATRLAVAGLPAAVARLEFGVIAAGALYAVGAVMIRQSNRGTRAAVQLALTAVNTAISLVVFAVAAPWLPDLAPISGAVVVASLFTVDLLLPRRVVMTATGILFAELVFLWAYAIIFLQRSPWTFVVYGLCLVSVGTFLYVGFQLVARRLQLQVGRTAAIANAAERVGLATDVVEVGAAVLQACTDSFPEADIGGIMLFDPAVGALRSLEVSLQHGEVVNTTGTPDIHMKPGEGLAGKTFLTGVARVWATGAEVAADHVSLRNLTRAEILKIAGIDHSGLVAPLRVPDRGVIGVLTLGSTTRENVFEAEDLPVLQGLAEQAALGIERARHFQEQRTQALTDPLTGLANYRQLKAILVQELARSRRAGEPMAVIFSDLDDFKAVNDRHGHGIGDMALRLYAETARRTLRAEDTAARYGGDEFVCVLPGSDEAQAATAVERIAHMFADDLAGDPLLGGVRTSVTAGVAVYPVDGETPEALLAAADTALRRAKAQAGDGGLTAPIQV